MIVYTLSNAGYRVSLRGLGTELEGVGHSNIPDPARLAPSIDPFRVKCIIRLYY